MVVRVHALLDHALAAPGRVEMDFQVEIIITLNPGSQIFSAEEAAALEVLELMDHTRTEGRGVVVMEWVLGSRATSLEAAGCSLAANWAPGK